MTEQVKYRGFTIQILPDEYPDDPRSWDNLGIMVCWHHRYRLGDERPVTNSDQWRESIEREIAVILPVYLYDHSGLTIRTRPFRCPWDSGQIGWIWVSKKRLREEYGAQRISEKLRQKAEGILRQEVKTYNDYLTNAVYGWRVQETDDIESCWGYYGDPRGYMLSEARASVDHYIQKVTERHAKQLKAWLFHKAPLYYRRPFPLEDSYESA